MVEREQHQVTGITIDSEHTRDIDDAIWVDEVSEDLWGPEPQKFWRVRVSIANIAAAVQLGGADDENAKRLVTTKYYAAGDSPMLPRQLSEHDLSLWPHRAHRVLTIEMRLSQTYEVVAATVYPATLVSLAKLSYTNVPRILANKDNKFHEMLTQASKLALGLLERRRNEGALVLYDLNQGWVTTEEGQIKVLNSREDTIGYVIIQELMILANAELAKYAVQKDVPLLFRNHAASTAAPDRQDLMKQISDAVNTPIGNVEALRQRTHMLLDRAKYAPQLFGHYGLNLPAYTHLTSPIRRYADLVNQRQLLAHLNGLDFPYTLEQLKELAEHINTVTEAERTSTAEHLKAKAEQRAVRHIDGRRLEGLGAREFERVTKVEARSGEEPSDTFREAYVKRLHDNRLPLICMTTLFTEAPRTTGWNELRTETLTRVSPPNAFSVLTQASHAGKWPTASFNVREEGPDHERVFTATALVTVEGVTITSVPFTARATRDAKQRAAVGLLAALYGLDPPKFAPDHAVANGKPKKRIKIDTSKNPITALQEYAQGSGSASPVYTYESDGPGHNVQFVCNCSFLDSVGTGRGPSKQIAKMAAAGSVVSAVASQSTS